MDPPGIDITIQGVVTALGRLACWTSSTAELIVVGAIIFYGIQAIWSRGNPQTFTTARTGLTYAVVGGLVVLGAWVIIVSVTNLISEGVWIPAPLQCL